MEPLRTTIWTPLIDFLPRAKGSNEEEGMPLPTFENFFTEGITFISSLRTKYLMIIRTSKLRTEYHRKIKSMETPIFRIPWRRSGQF